MGPPARLARGSLEDHFARASSTLGSLGTEAHSISRFQAHAGFQGEAKAQPPSATTKRESVPPDVALAAARKRVEKFEVVLITLGEDDETFPLINVATPG